MFAPTLTLTISDDFTLTERINTICRKVAYQLFLLRRLSYRTRSVQILRGVYVCYIRPLFEYAVPSWIALRLSQVERLEKLQRRAIRIILNLPYVQHLTPGDYASVDLDPLLARRNLAAACYGYKLINAHLPRLLRCYEPHRMVDGGQLQPATWSSLATTRYY